MKSYTRIALGLAAFLASFPALSLTYAVGPGRTYTTVDALLSQVDLEPGDVVEIDGDTVYAGGLIVESSHSGSVGNPVTFLGISSAGNRPHFFGSANNTIENRANFVVFENIEISGDVAADTRRCFFHHSHEVILRGVYVHDCPQQGILGADTDSGSLTIEYSEVFNIGGDSRDHAIYMATDEVAYPGAVFRLQFSYVHDSNFDESSIGGNLIKSRAERNEIYYNWLEGAYYHELELIGPDPFGAQGGWTESLAREDSDIVGNVILHTEPFGSILRFGGDATGQSFGRYRFVNNTVIRVNGGSATVFRLFDGIGTLEAHNNILWNDGSESLRVIREVEAIWASGMTTITGSNNWIKQGATFHPDGFAATIFGSDPGLQNAAGRDFRPATGSPLIDAGSAKTATAGFSPANPLTLPAAEPPTAPFQTQSSRFIDGPVDIGAFEWPDSDLFLRDGFEGG